MSQTGIYGGSFNPVHEGHTGLCKWILRHTELDEIWMMVSPNNPLKPNGILADEKERFVALCERLTQENETGEAKQGKAAVICGEKVKHITASNFEFDMPRPSYTADTLRRLKEKYPDKTFTLIIGEDNWRQFKRWRDWEDIAKEYAIIVYPRKTRTSGEEEEPAELTPQENECMNVSYMSGAPYFDISSTEIRHNVKAAKNSINNKVQSRTKSTKTTI